VDVRIEAAPDEDILAMRTLVTSNGQLYQLSINDKHVVIQHVRLRGGSLKEIGRVEIPFRDAVVWNGVAWVSEAMPRVGLLFSRYWRVAQSEAAH
jgi:hypothetical protein